MATGMKRFEDVKLVLDHEAYFEEVKDAFDHTKIIALTTTEEHVGHIVEIFARDNGTLSVTLRHSGPQSCSCKEHIRPERFYE